ncbi:hypothetical protein [Bartonella sp. ML70XJBT.G]|uniref:hypothetical protein n=1 Tax=Bartonella sp. ML70XJBT.G TaxID=3019093 RepID=UPI002361A388|nr:hypothetical protein [Bartonella sp. ML70XJBT.G]
MFDYAIVCGCAFMNGKAKIYNSPLISIRAKLGGNSEMCGDSFIQENAEIINDGIPSTGERQ